MKEIVSDKKKERKKLSLRKKRLLETGTKNASRIIIIIIVISIFLVVLSTRPRGRLRGSRSSGNPPELATAPPVRWLFLPLVIPSGGRNPHLISIDADRYRTTSLVVREDRCWCSLDEPASRSVIDPRVSEDSSIENRNNRKEIKKKTKKN